MNEDNKNSIGHKIKDLFLDDQIGTTPNENRLFIIGLLPAALGLTGGGMSLYLCLFPDDKKHYAMLPGFILAAFFGWFAQISMRRAFQMRDQKRRIVLLTKMRIIPTISITLAFIGLALTLIAWFFPPTGAHDTFFALTVTAIVLTTFGVLLTPFSFAARRISWLVHPR